MKQLISFLVVATVIVLAVSCSKAPAMYKIKYSLVTYSVGEYSYFQILNYKDPSGVYVNGYSSDSVAAQSWSKTIYVTKPFTAKLVAQSGNFTSAPYSYYLVIIANDRDTTFKQGLANANSGVFTDSVSYTIP